MILLQLIILEYEFASPIETDLIVLRIIHSGEACETSYS